jgi:hypothetical protein
VSRHIVEEGTAESADGFTITVKGLTEDKALGAPCMANRGAVDLVVTGPDGTTMSFRLPGEQAAHILRPVAIGATPFESEADIARRYLRDATWLSPEQAAYLNRRIGED